MTRLAILLLVFTSVACGAGGKRSSDAASGTGGGTPQLHAGAAGGHTAGSAATGGRLEPSAGSGGRAGAGGRAQSAGGRIKADEVLPQPPLSPNKLSATAPTGGAAKPCTVKLAACDEACRTQAMRGADGCNMVAGFFATVSTLRIAGNSAYVAARRKDNLGNIEEGVYRVALDGSDTTLLGKFDDCSLGPVYEDQLIVYARKCVGVDPSDLCINTLPLGGGAATQIFPDLLNTTIIVGNGTAVYKQPGFDIEAGVTSRSLFDGEPIGRFATTNLFALESDGVFAFFSRSLSNQKFFYLTELGVAGTTLQLGTEPYQLVQFVDDYLYLVRHTSSLDDAYERIKLGSNKVEPLARLPFSPEQYLVHGRSLYVFNGDGPTDYVYRMPLEGGPLVGVATFTDHELKNFEVTDDALYAVVQTPATTAIMRWRCRPSNTVSNPPLDSAAPRLDASSSIARSA